MRQGQFSTYLKPILILIFAVLLLFIVQNVMNFRTNVQEQQERTQFYQEIRRDHQALIDCLSVNETVSSNNFLLNQSKLVAFEQRYLRREPPCAEDFRYGYNVTISQSFLTGKVQAPASGKDIVLVIDRSGSMGGGKLSSVQSAAKNFIDQASGDTRFGLVSFGGGVRVDQDLTEDAGAVRSAIDSLSSSGGTPLASAISQGVSGISWEDGTPRGMVVLSDGRGGTVSSVRAAGDDAREENIDIHGIMYGSGASASHTEAYSGADTCSKGGSENGDSDNCWWAASGDELETVYEGIGEDIGGNTVSVGSGSTCTVPSTRSYRGTVDLVFIADTSASYSEEWEVICNSVQSTIDELEAKGLDANVSVYGLTPDADEIENDMPASQRNFSGNDQGYEMTTTNGDFDYVPGEQTLPSCLPQNDDDIFAYRSWYGPGLTTWEGTGLDQYRPGRDHGLEAWGVAAKWVFEHHTFREDTDGRFMFLFGDTYPTGSGDANDFRDEDVPFTEPDRLDTDPEIIQNVTAWADRKDVTIHTFVGSSWEGSTGHTDYNDDGVEDAKELMQETASETGGEFFQYTDAENIPSIIKNLFSSVRAVSGGTCENQAFSFGEQQGSTGPSLRNQLTFTYPATIWHSNTLQTPGSLTIKLRAGDLEQLAGAINRITSQGRTTDRAINATLRYVNEQRIVTDTDHTVQHPQKTTYYLENTDTGGNIEVDEQLIIGVNGHLRVNQTSSGGSMTLSSGPSGETAFTAYPGAHVQVIAVNKKESTQHIDPLQIDCDGCSTPQVLTEQTRSASEGDDSYTLGTFHHNFTTLQHGPTEPFTGPAVCLETDGDPHCVMLRADQIDEIELSPGSHFLRLGYRPSSDRVIIDE